MGPGYRCGDGDGLWEGSPDHYCFGQCVSYNLAISWVLTCRIGLQLCTADNWLAVCPRGRTAFGAHLDQWSEPALFCQALQCRAYAQHADGKGPGPQMSADAVLAC